jgi:hypothetical protein
MVTYKETIVLLEARIFLIMPSLLEIQDFTPIHSLTGPVGQPFASRLGGATVGFPGVLPHFWNWDLLLAMSCYIGDPDVMDHDAKLGSAPTM